MYIMADGLTRLIAPILSVTADELWQLPARSAARNRCTSSLFPTAGELDPLVDRELLDRWTRLTSASRTGARRDRAAAQGQAHRQLTPGQGRALGRRRDDLAFLERYDDELPMLFIVSDVELRPAPAGPADGQPASRSSAPTGVKCERCWRYVKTVSQRTGVGRTVRSLPGRAGTTANV